MSTVTKKSKVSAQLCKRPSSLDRQDQSTGVIQMFQARERQLNAARSFQRIAARYYWLSRNAGHYNDCIYWQQEAAQASKYARQLMLIETEN